MLVDPHAPCFLDHSHCKPVEALQRFMAAAGWEITYLDIDLTRAIPTARIVVMRADGRWLLGTVDTLGRANLATFHRERRLEMDARTRGRRPLTPTVQDHFLGRRSFQGARAMLRGLTSYVADNSAVPVSLSEVRRAWATVLDGRRFTYPRFIGSGAAQ